MRRLQLFLAGWLALATAACSLMISGEDTPLRCTDEGVLGPPACDAGLTCREGRCVRDPDSAATGGAAGVTILTQEAGAAGEGGAGAVGELDG